MPTVDPPAVSVQAADFKSLISNHLTALHSGLTQSCERLATERESSLLEENRQLQQENQELRLRLEIEGGLSVTTAATKQTDLPGGPTVLVQSEGNNQNETVKPLAIVPTTSGATVQKTVTNRDVAFTLCKEYLDVNFVETEMEESGACDAGFFDLWAQDGPDASKLIAKKAKSLVVDPSSARRLFWDMLGIPILSWDLITIPLGVFDMGPGGDAVMAGAGWVTLIYWSFDLPFTFLTGFYDGDGDLVMDMRRIAMTYMRGFFGLDILIILADWFSVILKLVGSSGGALENMSILRVFRITRFVRLLRLRKLKAKIQAIEDQVNSEWVLVIMNLVGKVSYILMLNHYIGCAWVFIGSQDSFDVPTRRWLTSIPYPQYDDVGLKISDSEWSYQYLTSLHWAIAQFTPGPQNIQPQNCAERLFAVFILLFGLVIFSSFIAGVTQARMALAKMTSKLDRDMWLLRKYCQQHNVSKTLTIRMKRYIDLVIVPNFHKLNPGEVVLLPKLSAHLRGQLNQELVMHDLKIHPFFEYLNGNHDSVMSRVCNNCITNMSFARGDVAFGSGQVATSMLIVKDGIMDFIAMLGPTHPEPIEKGHWVSEAVLWTKWIHQGQLQASIESTAVLVDSAKLKNELIKNGPVMGFVRTYAHDFIRRLNAMAESCPNGMPTDIHDVLSPQEHDLNMPKRLSATSFLWKS